MKKKSDLSNLQAKIPGFERVVVAVKPDGVKRALTGEVIRRMETLGLKMVAGKMEVPTRAKAKGNYPDVTTPAGHEWMVNLGRKTLKTYADAGNGYHGMGRPSGGGPGPGFGRRHYPITGAAGNDPRRFDF